MFLSFLTKQGYLREKFYTSASSLESFSYLSCYVQKKRSTNGYANEGFSSVLYDVR